jgi:hypothetical protein
MKVTMLVAALCLLCLLGTATQAQVFGPANQGNQWLVPPEQQRQDLYNMQQQQRQFQLDAQQQQQDQYNRLQEQRPVRCFNSFGQLVCQ